MSFKIFKAMVFGLEYDSIKAKVEAAGVPMSKDDCRTCADPCDVGMSSASSLCASQAHVETGHDEYPKRFLVDYISEMLGSVKPYRRQVSHPRSRPSCPLSESMHR
jgi:hypothetical protein